MIRQRSPRFSSVEVAPHVEKTHHTMLFGKVFDDAQQINDVLLKMLDRWNSHDIEGYIGGRRTYWL